MPYPDDHPYRAAFAELHNQVTNALFEHKITGRTELDIPGVFSVMLGSLDLFAYAIEDLLDQVDFDPERCVPRSVDEV
jgi:hypothetical protein